MQTNSNTVIDTVLSKAEEESQLSPYMMLNIL